MTTAAADKTTFGTAMQNFAPGWFAAVMGTGALAITSIHFGRTFPLLAYWAWALQFANFLLFIVLAVPCRAVPCRAVPWLGRWIFRREAAQTTVFRGEHIALDHVTPGMYIPPVGLVVVPMAGGPLMVLQPEALAEPALVLNFLWGPDSAQDAARRPLRAAVPDPLSAEPRAALKKRLAIRGRSGRTTSVLPVARLAR